MWDSQRGLISAILAVLGAVPLDRLAGPLRVTVSLRCTDRCVVPSTNRQPLLPRSTAQFRVKALFTSQNIALIQ